MPETYGLPEPEGPEASRKERVEEVATEVIAGQSIVRTTLLYAILFICIVSPLPLAAVVPAALLLATDKRLA